MHESRTKTLMRQRKNSRSQSFLGLNICTGLKKLSLFINKTTYPKCVAYGKCKRNKQKIHSSFDQTLLSLADTHCPPPPFPYVFPTHPMKFPLKLPAITSSISEIPTTISTHSILSLYQVHLEMVCYHPHSW